jgi:dephospho-CoA kinase
VVLLESPLLFEARQDDMCDAVICVVAREELRAKRVKRRDGMQIEDFKLRDEAQMSDDARRRLADIVIENNGSLEDLRRAVNAVKI